MQECGVSLGECTFPDRCLLCSSRTCGWRLVFHRKQRAQNFRPIPRLVCAGTNRPSHVKKQAANKFSPELLDYGQSRAHFIRRAWRPRTPVRSDDSSEVVQCRNSCDSSTACDYRTAPSAMNPWRLKPRKPTRTGKRFTKTAMLARSD